MSLEALRHPKLHRGKIGVIDDVPDNYKLLKVAFEKAYGNVEGAPSVIYIPGSPDLIHTFPENLKGVNLLFSDLTMPNLDAVTLLRNIRLANELLPGIILFSGVERSILEAHQRAIPNITILLKPFDIFTELPEAVFQALGPMERQV